MEKKWLNGEVEQRKGGKNRLRAPLCHQKHSAKVVNFVVTVLEIPQGPVIHLF